MRHLIWQSLADTYFQHKIFKALDEVRPSANGEIQLTDGIAQLLADGQKVFAYKIKGIRHDVGTPMGWLKANIELAKQDPASLFIIDSKQIIL